MGEREKLATEVDELVGLPSQRAVSKAVIRGDQVAKATDKSSPYRDARAQKKPGPKIVTFRQPGCLRETL
jgi:hypothetical protein